MLMVARRQPRTRADNTIKHKIIWAKKYNNTGPKMMTSYDEIAELVTQPADQQSAEEQTKGVGTARPTRRQAEAAVELLLRWAGDDPAREGLIDTPARVVRSYEEFFSGYYDNPEEMLARTFEEVEGYDDMVMLRDIALQSHCEHHMVPILGVAHMPICQTGGWSAFLAGTGAGQLCPPPADTGNHDSANLADHPECACAQRGGDSD